MRIGQNSDDSYFNFQISGQILYEWELLTPEPVMILTWNLGYYPNMRWEIKMLSKNLGIEMSAICDIIVIFQFMFDLEQSRSWIPDFGVSMVMLFHRYLP